MKNLIQDMKILFLIIPRNKAKARHTLYMYKKAGVTNNKPVEFTYIIGARMKKLLV